MTNKIQQLKYLSVASKDMSNWFLQIAVRLFRETKLVSCTLGWIILFREKNIYAFLISNSEINFFFEYLEKCENYSNFEHKLKIGYTCLAIMF